MTYNHDLERNKYAGSGLGDYNHVTDTDGGSGKWYLIAIAAIIGLLVVAGLFSGETVVPDENGASISSQAPAVPETAATE